MYVYITGAKAAFRHDFLKSSGSERKEREKERESKSQSPFCGHGTKSLVHATRSSKRNTFLLSTKFAHIIMQKLSTDYKQSFYETEPRTVMSKTLPEVPGLLPPYRWIFKKISFVPEKL